MKFRFALLGPDGEPDRNDEDLSSDLSPALWYEQRGANIVRVERRKSGLKITALTSFHARIVRDIVIDDGEVQQRHFGIEAELKGKKIAFSMSASEFSRMGWVLNRLGPQAIVYPVKQQHARAAIQWLSRDIPKERIFAHLGWTKHDDKWVYLHAGGAVGTDGFAAGLQVQVPAALQYYRVTPLQDPGGVVRAVRGSLRFLSLAPDRITFPLFAAVYRAPFGKVDFSVFITGQTGTFKTALAALCQQHFGAEMDASALPANFASTANALEGLAFTAKDALLVVDDFVPAGSDTALQSMAERLFRAAGNGQGRSRMRGNGGLRPPQPPRALLLATGEEVPRGQSLRARLLIVDVGPGGVDRRLLNECQNAGRQGLLAAAMGAFITWIASRYEQLQRQIDMRTRELRDNYKAAIHARLPTALASLQSGFEIWLQFAFEVGAIDTSEKEELQRRSASALNELAALQTRYHQANDPALCFIALLRAALATGRAHVANRLGKAPESPQSWGWRRRKTGWVPNGTRIGWITGTDLYLDSAIGYRTVREMATPDDRLPLSEQTLRHRLRERGILASVDPGREMLQIRRTLEGQARHVLHLKATRLAE
jgi:hypothetical protein